MYIIRLSTSTKWLNVLSVLIPSLTGASLLLSRLLLYKHSYGVFVYFLPLTYLFSVFLVSLVVIIFYVNGNLLLSGMPQKIIRDKIYLLPEQENIGEEK